MQFARSLFCLSLFTVAAYSAKLTNSADDFNKVSAGKPFTVTWAEASGPVTLLLKTGQSTDLRTVSTLASGQNGNSYVWTPENSLPSGTYALQIDDASGSNYSVQFTIRGAAAAPAPAVLTTSAMYAPSSSMAYSTGYPSGISSHVSPIGSNMTSTMSNSARATSTFASASSTGYANVTSTRVPATTSTSPATIPSDSNAAAGVASPIALMMLVLAAAMMTQ